VIDHENGGGNVHGVGIVEALEESGLSEEEEEKFLT